MKNISIMNDFTHLSDRELLEAIYVLLIEVHRKLDRIDDDERQLGINVFANLFSDIIHRKSN
jgi:hypothetical protein